MFGTFAYSVHWYLLWRGGRVEGHVASGRGMMLEMTTQVFSDLTVDLAGYCDLNVHVP